MPAPVTLPSPRLRRVVRLLVMTQGLTTAKAYELAVQRERGGPVWDRFLKEYGLKESDFAEGER